LPWCPDCKTEYREGFSVCSDCGAALAGDYPQERQAPLNPHEDVRLVLLADAGDVVEADILRSMLEESGIPVVSATTARGSF
jgi:predicted amidophosphoribosyltransferase